LIIGGLFFAFYTLVLKKDGESSTPEVTVIKTQTVVADVTDTATAPLPTDTATSEPDTELPATATTIPITISPTNTPTPIPTLRPPPEVITIGVRAQVSIGEGNALNLRDQPTRAGNAIAQLAHGVDVNVLDGPEYADDLRWWNVDGGADQVGWVVDALGGETWLVPIGWTDQMTLTPALTAEPTLTPTLASPTAIPVVTPTATFAPTATPALTPTAIPETPPTATPVLSPTATPVLSPTNTPEGGIPSPTVGGRAQVTTQYQFINLRDEPGQGTNVIAQLANGTVVTILDGPQDVTDLRWWKVDDGQGNVGWAAERVGAEVLLVPIP
jgi:hypothetical protein